MRPLGQSLDGQLSLFRRKEPRFRLPWRVREGQKSEKCDRDADECVDEEEPLVRSKTEMVVERTLNDGAL